ncbi:unnamed protein product [Nyctereutes procyonoides]|uniref:Peptidyl-prolyl cis-trans isomerase n=1 Tax=Nyctereutes procyonoides TaxID=34880 RepID=A0A811ZHG2_NYCPR|nr:unnamed protein product [Nyctereutes procyonoides]CAD7688130.1 unnamed protein product [Nyctereutes procyonoides]
MINPTIFFDIAMDSEPLGQSSETTENFHTLSAGEKGFGFKVSCFHGIFPGFICHSGEFTCYNGTGGKAIYGEKFDDENFILKHMSPGILQFKFFICAVKVEWLDGKHVVCGKVKDSMNITEAMVCFGSRNGKTSKKITFAECG